MLLHFFGHIPVLDLHVNLIACVGTSGVVWYFVDFGQEWVLCTGVSFTAGVVGIEGWLNGNLEEVHHI